MACILAPPPGDPADAGRAVSRRITPAGQRKAHIGRTARSPSYVRNMKAMWNDEIIAESDETVVVEGNHYFPRTSLREDVLRDSDTHTVCPWKGRASYYSLELNGQTSQDAVWYYPEPKPDAKAVRDRVAFWKDVKVVA
jgi:uncharacterized protein (DUF427 family)